MKSATYHANYLTLMAVIVFYPNRSYYKVQHSLADIYVNLMKIIIFESIIRIFTVV